MEVRVFFKGILLIEKNNGKYLTEVLRFFGNNVGRIYLSGVNLNIFI